MNDIYNNTPIATILGIDPGTFFLGFCLLRYNVITGELISIKTKLSKALSLPSYQEPYFDNNDIALRKARIIAQQASLQNMLLNEQPHIVCCESAFYDRRHPTAYGPLVDIISSLYHTTILTNILLPFYTYEPLTVKKALGLKGQRTKDMIQEFIKTDKTILSVLEDDVMTLSQHEIDAISIAYTHYLLDLNISR